MHALPLVFVAISAIFLQPVAAQGKKEVDIDHASILIIKGDGRRSAMLLLDGSDNSRDNYASFVFTQNLEGHTIQERDSKCIYPVNVRINGLDKPPLVGELEDDCTIKKNPTAKDIYAKDQTYKVTFNGDRETVVEYHVDESVLVDRFVWDSFIAKREVIKIDNAQLYSIFDYDVEAKEWKTMFLYFAGDRGNSGDRYDMRLYLNDPRYPVVQHWARSCTYTTQMMAYGEPTMSFGKFHDNCRAKAGFGIEEGTHKVVYDGEAPLDMYYVTKKNMIRERRKEWVEKMFEKKLAERP